MFLIRPRNVSGTKYGGGAGKVPYLIVSVFRRARHLPELLDSRVRVQLLETAGAPAEAIDRIRSKILFESPLDLQDGRKGGRAALGAHESGKGQRLVVDLQLVLQQE